MKTEANQNLQKKLQYLQSWFKMNIQDIQTDKT